MFSFKYSGKVTFYIQKLNRRVKVAKNRALYRAAGLLRTATKRSMRLRPGPSRAGRPPHAHTRTGLRVIEFVVDDAANAAMVGPIKFAGSRFFDEPVPHIQEFGGVFVSRKSYHRYPERSYMHYTLKKLVNSGALPKSFAYGMAQVL